MLSFAYPMSKLMLVGSNMTIELCFKAVKALIYTS